MENLGKVKKFIQTGFHVDISRDPYNSVFLRALLKEISEIKEVCIENVDKILRFYVSDTIAGRVFKNQVITIITGEPLVIEAQEEKQEETVPVMTVEEEKAIIKTEESTGEIEEELIEQEPVVAETISLTKAIRFDKKLSHAAKLFYGEIVSLIGEGKCCMQSNKYFGDLYGLSNPRASKIVKELSDAGLIVVDSIKGQPRKISLKKEDIITA